MGLPKASVLTLQSAPDLNNPKSILDLINYVASELLGVSAALVTRMCEAEYGITREEWQFIAMLKTKGMMSPSDLAAATTIDASQTSKTINSMVTKGFVQRTTVAHDRRRAKVQLTDKGHALFDQVFPRVTQFHHHLLSDLTPEEKEVLAMALFKMQSRAHEVFVSSRPEQSQGRRLGGRR